MWHRSRIRCACLGPYGCVDVDVVDLLSHDPADLLDLESVSTMPSASAVMFMGASLVTVVALVLVTFFVAAYVIAGSAPKTTALPHRVEKSQKSLQSLPQRVEKSKKLTQSRSSLTAALTKLQVDFTSETSSPFKAAFLAPSPTSAGSALAAKAEPALSFSAFHSAPPLSPDPMHRALSAHAQALLELLPELQARNSAVSSDSYANSNGSSKGEANASDLNKKDSPKKDQTRRKKKSNNRAKKDKDGTTAANPTANEEATWVNKKAREFAMQSSWHAGKNPSDAGDAAQAMKDAKPPSPNRRTGTPKSKGSAQNQRKQDQCEEQHATWKHDSPVGSPGNKVHTWNPPHKALPSAARDMPWGSGRVREDDTKRLMINHGAAHAAPTWHVAVSPPTGGAVGFDRQWSRARQSPQRGSTMINLPSAA
eukprot:gene5973-5258_t